MDKKDLDESQTSNNSALSKTEASRLLKDLEEEKRKSKEKDDLIISLIAENEILKLELSSNKASKTDNEVSWIKAENEHQKAKIAELKDANDTVFKFKVVCQFPSRCIASFGLL